MVTDLILRVIRGYKFTFSIKKHQGTAKPAGIYRNRQKYIFLIDMTSQHFRPFIKTFKL